MCGIVSRLNYSSTIESESSIRKMLDVMVHRGPDDEGIYTSNYIGLGQRRLSIIDLNRQSTAPLHNEDKTVWVVFNGEIYNYIELREKLESKGHQFYTHSDTEVIVHLYEEYQESCLDYLRGMFAIIIWDSSKKELFLARDRFGKKPLFYTKQQGVFIASSTINAILVNGEVSVEPDYSAIDHYLSYKYVPSPLSAFKNIYKLPPAHYMKCTVKGDVSIKRYWSPPVKKETKYTKGETEELLTDKIKESIKHRMISDVPLGAFLSGGIDSGIIVGMMSELGHEKVKTFSIGFEQDEYNELPYARQVAERYQTDHHEFIVKPNAMDILDIIVRDYGEPFADPSAIPTYYVSKMTREHVTVALSGDGGDEVFAGYSHYKNIKNINVYRSRLQFMSSVFIGADKLLSLFPQSGFNLKSRKAMKILSSDLPTAYHQYLSIVKDQEKEFLYTEKFRTLINHDKQNYNVWEGLDENKYDVVEWMMNHDQRHYLPDCLMVKSDVASMSNSLEVRAPFLDHELAEFLSTIPVECKLNNSSSKYILKKIAENYLPDVIINKPKTGFAMPIGSWFSGEMSLYIKDLLLGDKSINRNLFDRKMLSKIVNDHITGRRDWSNRLWVLMMLELWFREYID